MARLPIALQLYTVRDNMEKDYVGTLRRVAEIGYTAVEVATPTTMPVAELKAVLTDLGLRAVASHISFDDWTSDPSGALAGARELGCTYAVCSSIPEESRGDAEVYRALGAALSRAAATALEYGLHFAYHNHAFEFERLGDPYAYDILMGAANPDSVAAEFDVYWAQYAGVDPVAYIRKLGRRCRLIHMKDMLADADRSFAEVGEGILDMDTIVDAGMAAGVEWYIVEQDLSPRRSSLEAAALSLRNMKARGWA